MTSTGATGQDRRRSPWTPLVHHAARRLPGAQSFMIGQRARCMKGRLYESSQNPRATERSSESPVLAPAPWLLGRARVGPPPAPAFAPSGGEPENLTARTGRVRPGQYRR
jgi:hypothetical protein